jgi:glycosyltransferase involved in cell wall biosynthesis
VITASNPAIETAFGDALITVPAGDPAALADAVRALRGPDRLAVAARARAAFEERYSEAALARDLDALLAGVLSAP